MIGDDPGDEQPDIGVQRDLCATTALPHHRPRVEARDPAPAPLDFPDEPTPTGCCAHQRTQQLVPHALRIAFTHVLALHMDDLTEDRQCPGFVALHNGQGSGFHHLLVGTANPQDKPFPPLGDTPERRQPAGRTHARPVYASGPMSLLSDLTKLVGDAFAEHGLDRELGKVVVSQRPELAQFQCNGAMAGAKTAKKSPREIAEAICVIVSKSDVIKTAEIAGPGFINIVLTDAELANRLKALAADERLGVTPVDTRHKIVLDYGGPNVAKDLHVGHLRTALIGESLKRMLRYVGEEATGDVHLGDWGAPMGQLIAEMELRNPDLPYFDPERTSDFPTTPPVTIDDLQAMYPEAARRVKEDPEFAEAARRATVELQAGRPGYKALWKHFRSVSVEALRSVYDALDVHFDLWLGEASVHDRIAPLVKRLREAGVAVESDGALVIPVARPEDDKEIPPFMLVNSRGGYTYATTDLATIEERVDDLGAEQIIYLVDQRQSLHFEQLFRAARRAGLVHNTTVLEHPGNGTVNGPDGRPFKTREGGIPRLRDTIGDAVDHAEARLDESEIAVDYPPEERIEIARRVGLAALKYGELSNHRTSDYSFDLDRFTQLQGRTGPYIQYVGARATSLLSKAADAGFGLGAPVPPAAPAERDLILEMSRFPEVLDRAIEHRAPNHLAEYAYDLAVRFNRFYDACHVLTERSADRRGSWLTLVAQLRNMLATVLGLLGIEIPERM